MLLDFLTLATLVATLAQTPDPRAVAVIDAAIARMGGLETLRGIERVRLETMTQWQRTTFEEHPYADRPTYEHHFEFRDYGVPAWRNTRRAAFGGQWHEITDLVRDSVAVRSFGRGWAPLNVTYVDEMREVFAFAPERVLLLAREADDVRLLADTVIDAVPHARIAATIDHFPAVLFFRKGDGLPTLVRYRAAHPNDFGLVSWGEMEVEVWFSAWQTLPNGVSLPMQRDVRRVGRPYKRMTVLHATFDTPAAPDSFAVSDELRAAYLATATRPMHDLPLDSARIVEDRLAWFGTPGSPVGAVKLGDRWLLLEAGVAPLSTERSIDWLENADPSAKIAGAIVTTTTPGNGGIVALAERRLPIYVARGAAPFARTILRNHRQPEVGLDVVSQGRWLHVAGDSIRIEPIDLPDDRGTALVYVPSLRWLYAATASTPLDLGIVLDHVRRRGWTVERIGGPRGLILPVPDQNTEISR